MKNSHLATLACILACVQAVSASTASAQTIRISQPWVAATVTGQHASAAFMTLTSDQPVTLIGTSSSVAGVTQVHEMAMDGGIMRMHALEKLPLAAGQPFALTPRGTHVMMMDLKQTLNAGDKVKLVFKFTSASGKTIQKEVEAEVRDRAKMGQQ